MAGHDGRPVEEKDRELKEDPVQIPSSEWELEALLDIFPPGIRQALLRLPNLNHLIEVILDLGRLPEARFPHDFCYLSSAKVTADDIAAVVDRIGEFGKDNRAGIEQTLHRISCLRNRSGKVVGLTCRVGRAVYGTIDIILDVVRSGKSILLLGKPGVGKTTMLREVARVLSGDLTKRVIIVDTSNEIAGDGDVPHAGIGLARRMQVDTPASQHAVMIEAVENHMPEAIVIDEIGTEAEALAARTIAERGVQLIGTAHGIDLDNILMNPTLSDLLGGVGAVTLSDEEAKRRGTRKTVLERKAPPTFDVLIEIQDRNRLAIHAPVADVVDSMLRGHEPRPEIRVRNEKGGVEVVQEAEAQTIQPRYAVNRPQRESFERRAAALAEPEADEESTGEVIRIFPYGVSRSKIERAVSGLRVPALIARKWDDADVVLTLKALERRDNGKLREIAAQNIPIYSLKTNTTAQIQTCLKDLYDLPSIDEEDVALREAEEAVYNVMLHHKPVELSPQSSYIRRLQHQLAEKYRLQSRSTGAEPNRRVRVFKESFP
jgi:stage III sporulation protein SpoIIIAA